jgi:hypothetical protein
MKTGRYVRPVARKGLTLTGGPRRPRPRRLGPALAREPGRRAGRRGLRGGPGRPAQSV